MNYRKAVLAIFALAFIFSYTTALASKDSNWKGDRIKTGSGKIITVERPTQPFNKIESNGAFDIEVLAGDELRIEITFYENIIEYIETKIESGTLYLGTDISYNSSHNCKVTIITPELVELSLRGSGNTYIEHPGGKSFECNLYGSGDITIVGKVDELDIILKGSGDIDTRNLETADAVVEIFGSGSVDVFASQSIDATIFGSGDIRYYGNPLESTTKVQGSGEIRRRR